MMLHPPQQRRSNKSLRLLILVGSLVHKEHPSTTKTTNNDRVKQETVELEWLW